MQVYSLFHFKQFHNIPPHYSQSHFYFFVSVLFSYVRMPDVQNKVINQVPVLCLQFLSAACVEGTKSLEEW